MKFKLGILSLLILIFTSYTFAGIPAEIKLQGWIRAKEPIVYSREKLTDHINGAAEIYYTYAVKDVTVYEFEQKGKGTISVDIYDMTNPDDAFGIYSFNRSGSKDFVEVGNEGVIGPGLLDFWIAQYYVRVSTGLDTKLSNTDLIGVGKSIAGNLATKKAEEPKLVKFLLKDGLVPGSSVYFHQKLILNNVCPEVNKFIDLKLTDKTNAVYAEYESDKKPASLLIIDYPNKKLLSEVIIAQKSIDSFHFQLIETYIIIFLNANKPLEEKLASEINKQIDALKSQ
jgi:hypothetical protein